ncbi:MAG: hypothetical protein DWP94_05400 [Flavobacterium sp.]|nr:MAG: hypothetical protein DWP94_05400 [Flavobacterium sp.]
MHLKYLFLVLAVLLFSCKNEDDGTSTSECDQVTIISAEQFENAPNAPLTIIDMSIEGDCLKVEFSASGCSGESWEVKLIDKGVVLESSPPIRLLRVSLLNNEACLAVFTRELTFDLTDLQLPGTNEIFLNIANSDEQILYMY